MFEKEAEEILNNHCDCELLSECMTGIRCRCSYFEESKKLLIEGIEFGYNKANEWHYVKDGNPEELQDVLCFVIHNEHRYFLQGYLRDGRWILSPLGTYLNNEDVIAWKEIVLPELKESE